MISRSPDKTIASISLDNCLPPDRQYSIKNRARSKYRIDDRLFARLQL